VIGALITSIVFMIRQVYLALKTSAKDTMVLYLKDIIYRSDPEKYLFIYPADYSSMLRSRWIHSDVANKVSVFRLPREAQNIILRYATVSILLAFVESEMERLRNLAVPPSKKD
jgi:hypothetical protein